MELAWNLLDYHFFEILDGCDKKGKEVEKEVDEKNSQICSR